MRRILFITISLLLNGLLWAQNPELKSYSWEKTLSFPQTDTLRADRGAVFLLERILNEVYVNNDQRFEEMHVYHRQVRVTTTDALAAYNRMYVPLDNVLEMIDLKARFIKRNGSVVELPRESIKEVQNLDNKGNFKVFAIEGAEVGGIIEFYYILRKEFTPFNTVTVQSNVPKLNFEAAFAYPEKLIYMFKSYNGLPQFTLLPDRNGKKYASLKVPYVEPLESEQYSAYNACLKRFEFTLAYNKYSGALRVYSWSKAANYFYGNLYVLEKNEQKALAKYLKGIKTKNLDSRSKIRAIEEQVKSEIAVSTDIPSNLTLDKMIDYKQAHKRGVTKMLIHLYRLASIPCELVLTTDRLKRTFDPEFNGMNFLDEFMLYFPDIDDYILPDVPQTRLGVVPDNFTGNYGIFFHPIKYNDQLQTLGYELKFIPGTDYLKNADSTFINITIDPQRLQMEVNTRRVFTGTLAQNFQAFWDFVPTERRTEMLNSIFNMGSDNNQIKSYEVANSSPSDIGLRPIVWSIVQVAPWLIEQAGDEIVVKVGEVIGEQSQLYRVKERKLPVDVNNIMHYFRLINLTIPEGYRVDHPDDLAMRVEMINNGRVSCAFTSEYTLIGNCLKIVVHEYYTEQTYPVERFEEFRAVINAAADFNKKTVVLTKK